MLTMSKPCPRCQHEKSILRVVWSDPIKAGVATVIAREILVTCVHCEKQSIAIVQAPANLSILGSSGCPTGDIAQHQVIKVMRLLPAPVTNDAPDHVPAQVGSAYVEGKAILGRGMWTPAAGSFRTALDRATKLLWNEQDIAGEMPFKLEKRLKALEQRLSMPRAMLSWADSVRVVGNEMHELDDVSEQDARDVAHFCEMFLTYAFTLAARIKQFQARRESEPS